MRSDFCSLNQHAEQDSSALRDFANLAIRPWDDFRVEKIEHYHRFTLDCVNRSRTKVGPCQQARVQTIAKSLSH
jgi:hypothetical protein